MSIASAFGKIALKVPNAFHGAGFTHLYVLTRLWHPVLPYLPRPRGHPLFCLILPDFAIYLTSFSGFQQLVRFGDERSPIILL